MGTTNHTFKKSPWREAEKLARENDFKAPQSLDRLPHRIPPRENLQGLGLVAFGSSLRLVSHDRLHSEFAAIGMSKKAFQALLRALCVPSIHINNQTFVDATTFYICMHAILRPGQPDFYAPGSLLKWKHKARNLPVRTNVTPEWLLSHWEQAAQELVYSRDLMEPRLTPREINKLCRSAAQRLKDFAQQVPFVEFFNSFRTGAEAHYYAARPNPDRLTPSDPDPLPESPSS